MKKYLYLLLVLLALGGLSSCGYEPQDCPNIKRNSTPNSVFLTFDISGSTSNDKERYIGEVNPIVDRLSFDDVVYVTTISSNSIVSAEFSLTFEMPAYPDSTDVKSGSVSNKKLQFEAICTNQGLLLKDKKEELKKQIKEFLLNPKNVSSTTQILDSVFSSTRFFKTYPKNRKTMILLTDGVEDSELAKFDSKLPDDRLIETIKLKGRLPDLNDVRVFMIGANSSGRIVKDISTDYIVIRDFWLKYFAATGAILTEENYGKKSIRIDFEVPENPKESESTISKFIKLVKDLVGQ